MEEQGRMTIFLAGDSTVQSYSVRCFPQAGWGEQLIRYFADNDYRTVPAMEADDAHRSVFSNAVRYESRLLTVDNRAMGARSVKTFVEEGRMEDLLGSLSAGDWVLIQFGHNDANRSKEERYVTPGEFGERLQRDFIDPVRKRGANPVLVTPLALIDFDSEGHCRDSFPEYRKEMLALGSREDVPVIDLGRLSAEFNTGIGEEKCRELYLCLPEGIYPNWMDGNEDTAHIQLGGAYVFAGIVANALTKIPDFPCKRLVTE